jgi:hypothetical protein
MNLTGLAYSQIDMRSPQLTMQRLQRKYTPDAIRHNGPITAG